MDHLQIEKIRQDVSYAQEARNMAAKNFDEAQLNYKKELITVFEKMSLFSAGIISLSITFISALITEDKSILSTCFLRLPAYIFLYVSWIMLVINLIVGLAIRWIDALYIFFSSQVNFHEKRKGLQEGLIKFNTHYPSIVFSPDTNREQEIKTSEENVKTLKNILIPKTQKKETFYFSLLRVLQKSAAIAFIIGIILLLLFVIIVINRLILG